MRRLWLVGLLALMGCAKIHIDCPTSGATTVSVGGSTVGLTAIAMGQMAAQGAGFMGRASAAPAPSPAASYVDYSYIPIFGPDYASCNAQPPAQQMPIPLPVSVVPSK